MADLRNRFVCFAFGLAVLVGYPARAWPASNTTSARLSIPFTAVVESPFNNENVDISGHLSVTTIINRTSIPPKITAIAKPASDVTAVGETSMQQFVVRGKSRLTYYWPFAVTRITHTIPLRLYPPATSLPTPPLRLWLLQYRVDYDVDGQVTSMDATMVPDPSAGACSTVIEVCQ